MCGKIMRKLIRLNPVLKFSVSLHLSGKKVFEVGNLKRPSLVALTLLMPFNNSIA
jgi:hypothetical protein